MTKSLKVNFVMKTHGQQKNCQNYNFYHMVYLLVHMNSIECGNIVSKDELHRKHGS